VKLSFAVKALAEKKKKKKESPVAPEKINTFRAN